MVELLTYFFLDSVDCITTIIAEYTVEIVNYSATLCGSAVFTVRPSVRHVRVLYQDGGRYRQTNFSVR